MYTATEVAELYHEITGNSDRRQPQTVAPDFTGYFRKAFEEIDNLFVSEVADGN